MKRSNWAAIIVIAGIAAVAGSFLPWAAIGALSVGGLDGDGKITLFIGLGLIGVGLASSKPFRPERVALGILSVGLVGIAVYDYRNLTEASSSSGIFSGLVQPGIGLIAVAVAGFVGGALTAFPPEDAPNAG